MTSISSLGQIGSMFSDNQSSWQGPGQGRAGGVGEESQGGTLGCLEAGEWPGEPSFSKANYFATGCGGG